MTAVSDILARLPSLSQSDAELVGKALKARGSISASGKADGSDWLLEGLGAYCERQGLFARGKGVFGLSRRKAYKQYLQKRGEVVVFLLSLELQAKSKGRHRPQLAFLCAETLAVLVESRFSAEVMSGVGIPTLLLSQIDKVPEALDNAFPGYAANGLFGFVLQ